MLYRSPKRRSYGFPDAASSLRHTTPESPPGIPPHHSGAVIGYRCRVGSGANHIAITPVRPRVRRVAAFLAQRPDCMRSDDESGDADEAIRAAVGTIFLASDAPMLSVEYNICTGPRNTPSGAPCCSIPPEYLSISVKIRSRSSRSMTIPSERGRPRSGPGSMVLHSMRDSTCGNIDQCSCDR